jgi:hypothetical protein
VLSPERTIADCVSPIIDEDGEVLGTVLVIRTASEARRVHINALLPSTEPAAAGRIANDRHLVQIILAVPEDLEAAAERGQLGRVLANVLVEAARAIGSGSADANMLAVSAGTVAGEGVQLKLTDTRTGPTAVLVKVNEPGGRRLEITLPITRKPS